jgi:putative flippase GtrA
MTRAFDFGIAASIIAGKRKFAREFTRYGVASAAALACDVGVYALALGVMTPAVAGATGYASGLLIHYGLSSRWVFPDRAGNRRALPTFVRFAATGMLGLLITTATIGVLTASGLTRAFAAKGVAAGLAYAAVFLARRIYVFRPRHPAPGSNAVAA